MCKQCVKEMVDVAADDSSEKMAMSKLRLAEDHLQAATDKLGIIHIVLLSVGCFCIPKRIPLWHV